METNYGNNLNPEHSLRATRGMKGTRQKVIVMYNPSKMDQNQLLLVGLFLEKRIDVILLTTITIYEVAELFQVLHWHVYSNSQVQTGDREVSP